MFVVQHDGDVGVFVDFVLRWAGWIVDRQRQVLDLVFLGQFFELGAGLVVVGQVDGEAAHFALAVRGGGGVELLEELGGGGAIGAACEHDCDGVGTVLAHEAGLLAGALTGDVERVERSWDLRTGLWAGFQIGGNGDTGNDESRNGHGDE